VCGEFAVWRRCRYARACERNRNGHQVPGQKFWTFISSVMAGPFLLLVQRNAFALIAVTVPASTRLVQPQPSGSSGPREGRDGEASAEPLALCETEMQATNFHRPVAGNCLERERRTCGRLRTASISSRICGWPSRRSSAAQIGQPVAPCSPKQRTRTGTRTLPRTSGKQEQGIDGMLGRRIANRGKLSSIRFTLYGPSHLATTSAPRPT
jgi:hypothetical protein